MHRPQESRKQTNPFNHQLQLIKTQVHEKSEILKHTNTDIIAHSADEVAGSAEYPLKIERKHMREKKINIKASQL